jgi:hypothetical protein
VTFNLLGGGRCRSRNAMCSSALPNLRKSNGARLFVGWVTLFLVALLDVDCLLVSSLYD